MLVLIERCQNTHCIAAWSMKAWKITFVACNCCNDTFCAIKIWSELIYHSSYTGSRSTLLFAELKHFSSTNLIHWWSCLHQVSVWGSCWFPYVQSIDQSGSQNNFTKINLKYFWQNTSLSLSHFVSSPRNVITEVVFSFNFRNMANQDPLGYK